MLADLRGDDPFTPEDATRLAGGGILGKIVSLAQKFAAFDAASKLSALERVSSAAVVIDATGRATQMKNVPAQNLLGADFNLVRGVGSARSRQHSPTPAAGRTVRRRQAVSPADRRRSRCSVEAFSPDPSRASARFVSSGHVSSSDLGRRCADSTQRSPRLGERDRRSPASKRSGHCRSRPPIGGAREQPPPEPWVAHRTPATPNWPRW